jgi:hypothetical protein
MTYYYDGWTQPKRKVKGAALSTERRRIIIKEEKRAAKGRALFYWRSLTRSEVLVGGTRARPRPLKHAKSPLFHRPSYVTSETAASHIARVPVGPEIVARGGACFVTV